MRGAVTPFGRIEVDVVPVRVAQFTGSEEMMDGRVKTLHSKLHAALLARRDHECDMAALQERGWETIDLVAVNLYPFEEKAIGESLDLDGATSFIDIGGPTMLRAAAKNQRGVVVVPDPAWYGTVLEALRGDDGVSVPLSLGRELAAWQICGANR